MTSAIVGSAASNRWRKNRAAPSQSANAWFGAQKSCAVSELNVHWRHHSSGVGKIGV
jgi:hypothetical protein